MIWFVEFTRRYREGTIVKDAAWRAYDIESYKSKNMLKRALKALDYGSWEPDIAIRQITAHLVPGRVTREQVEHMLQLWIVWYRISAGVVTRARRRKDDEGRTGTD